MIATLTHKGCIRIDNGWRHDYIIVCDNGVIFETREDVCYKTGTRVSLNDDQCQFDSGWIEWKCDKDGLEYWTRSRPGGEVICPMCNNVETVPRDAIMMPFEGADMADYYEELNDV